MGSAIALVMIFQSLLKILLLCSFFVTATIRTETVSDSRNFSGELVVLGDNDTSTSNETADIAITTPYERVLNGTSGRAEESTAESKTFTKTGEKSNDTEGSTTESIFVPITKYSAISLTSQTPEANPEPCITKRRITVTSVSGVTKKTGLESNFYSITFLFRHNRLITAFRKKFNYHYQRQLQSRFDYLRSDNCRRLLSSKIFR